MKKFFLHSLFVALIANSIQARADVKPMPYADQTAEMAAGIYSVKVLKVGDLVYKVVALDTDLNHDNDETTIVVVGRYQVGGAAGFDNAFLVTPVGNHTGLDAEPEVVGNTIKLVFKNIYENKRYAVFYRYDTSSQTLVEIKK